VTTLLALLALLAAAWAGAALVGRFATAAGLVALLAGAVLGPAGLGLAAPELLTGSAPLAEVAVGWLALALGLSLGRRDGQAIRPARLLGANLLSLVAGLAVAAAVAAALGAGFGSEAGPLAWPRELLLVAGGAGAALAASARDTLAGVVRRAGAAGPVSDLACDLADSDDLVPIAATAALFALGPAAGPATALAARAGPAGVALAGAALGALLGLATGLLVRLDPRRDAAAAALFGVSLLGIGLSARLGVSSMATGLLLGLVAAPLSGQRALLSGLAAQLEAAVALPALLLAGAMLDPDPALLGGALPAAALAAVAAALAAKLLLGPALGLAGGAAGRAALGLALARLSPGSFGVFLGLAFALRFPGEVGRAVLACACAAFLAGELVAGPALRRALGRAGELPAPGGGAGQAPEAEAAR
jgi:hypothetical protein